MPSETTTAARRATPPAWAARWWALAEHRIGIVPIPVLLLLLPITLGLMATGKLPADLLVNIGVLAVGGFTLAWIGQHIPGLRQFGSAAIIAIFVPSYLAYAHVLPPPLAASITEFTKSSNFLYLFITAIIVGSIFGMDRHVLLTGFFKILVPLGIGSVMAAAVGTLVGTAVGLGAQHSFFYVVLPVMAGGVGEGAIPLSIGYASILHTDQASVFAQVLPPVMMGSLFAILLAGGLNVLGRIRPALTGNGRLEPGEHDEILELHDPGAAVLDLGTIGAALVTAVTLYLVGVLAQRLLGWPAPVVMLFLAVALKLTYLVPPSLERGAFVVYRFFAVVVTYPLLFAIGVAMTPWDKLTAALTLPNIMTVLATVLTMTGSGFAVAYFLPSVRLYPVEVAIVSACRCGQGGTGDVAILTAGDRMRLMPFAQIATRIGGALTVTLALILLRGFG